MDNNTLNKYDTTSTTAHTTISQLSIAEHIGKGLFHLGKVIILELGAHFI